MITKYSLHHFGCLAVYRSVGWRIILNTAAPRIFPTAYLTIFHARTVARYFLFLCFGFQRIKAIFANQNTPRQKWLYMNE